MSPKKYRSLRYKSGPDMDVDAYFLDRGDWMLFVMLKDPKLSLPDVAKKCAAEFERGKLSIVAGSLKTKDKSEPLVPEDLTGTGKVPDFVWAHEAGLQFRLETKEVLNPGLFLDQELNRLKLGELIRNKGAGRPIEGAYRMLNLFSFTGAFSVVVNCLGVETVSVDVSSRYLDWEKRNQGQNSEIKKPEWGDKYPMMRLIREDARVFTKRAVNRKETYNWIVIDPPTFSRSESDVWKVQEDLPPLVEQAIHLMDPKEGAILVSCNDSTWKAADFYSMFESIARSNGLTAERGALPEEYAKPQIQHPMKSIWLTKP